MKKQFIFLLGFLLFANCVPLCGQTVPARLWQTFIDSTENKAPAAGSKQASAYTLLEVQAGTRNSDIRSAGIEVIRQLDDSHFIVYHPAIENSPMPQDFIVKHYPLNQLWKLSPALLQRMEGINPAQEAGFALKVRSTNLFKSQVAHVSGLKIDQEYSLSGLLYIQCSYKTLFQSLLPLEQLTFADSVSPPARAESMLRDANLSVNKVNLVQHLYPLLDGKGIVASVKENSFDPGDLDLRGRYLPTAQSVGIISRHATEMATILAGAGNSSPKSKGVGPAALLASSDFSRLHPDPEEYFKANSISIQNHSYGTVIENYYGVLAHAYDLQTHRNPQLLHVFSAGNIGAATDTLGIYRSATGFANISGHFKMAKNPLVVAAIDSLKKLDAMASKGPAYDGRVKPELVAYSTEGSSNAAALVSGILSLLQQQYIQQHKTLPAAALLKAVLVNSSEDVGPPGIDFFSGYGNVDAHKALRQLQQERYFSASLAHQQELSFSVSIPSNARNLKISLSWSDPAAEPNASKALINDLDLSLTNETTGKAWVPWVLNAYPHPDSLRLPSKRGVDRLNTIEQISLAQPEEGMYNIKVSGFDVPEGIQEFFIAYHWDEAQHFSWSYPTGSDHMPHLGDRSSIFRWETTYTGEKAVLEYSLDKGKSWTLIAPDVDLSKKYYSWKAPHVYAPAIARMRIGDQVYTSDTFSISRPLSTSVGFNCPDSVMLSWHPVPGVEGYTVYKLGENYLEPVAISQDTFFVFKKEEMSEPYFAVAPRLDMLLEGVASPTFDYSKQGMGCYLAYFNAALKEEGVQLSLQLGTTYQLDQIYLERKEGLAYVPFQSFSPSISNSFSHLDKKAKQGLNEYRVRIALSGSHEILSDTIKIYFLSKDPFLLFPNPLSRQEQLHVFLKDFNTEKVYLTLFSLEGKAVLEKELSSAREAFSISNLNPGLYLYLLTAGKTRSSGKILVY